ncbi:MAG: hypothetical protein ACOCXA_00230 [Planctomycetota bacterium]
MSLRLGLLAGISLPPGSLSAGVGLLLGGPTGAGLLWGGLLGMSVSFTTGLVNHACYTRARQGGRLAGSIVAMALRLLAVMLACFLLQGMGRSFLVSCVLSLTGILVITILIDAVALTLPGITGAEDAKEMSGG